MRLSVLPILLAVPVAQHLPLYSQLLTGGHEPAPAELRGRSDREARRIPFPKSVLLLGVAEGLYPGDPVVHFEPCPPESHHVDAERAAVFVEAALRGVEGIQEAVEAMRAVAIEGAFTPDGSPVFAQLDRRLRELIELVNQRAHSTQVEGVALLDGSIRGLCFDTGPGSVRLHPLEESGLNLSAVGVGSMTNATASLVTIDTALYSITSTREELGIVQERLADGPALGGLREQERVLERMRALAVESQAAWLNTADRAPLDQGFQLDLERLRDVAEQTTFFGISLLDGTTALQLEGAPPLPLVLEVSLLDARPLALSLASLTLLDGYSAHVSQLAIDSALDVVRDERRRLARLQGTLSAGRLSRVD